VPLLLIGGKCGGGNEPNNAFFVAVCVPEQWIGGQENCDNTPNIVVVEDTGGEVQFAWMNLWLVAQPDYPNKNDIRDLYATIEWSAELMAQVWAGLLIPNESGPGAEYPLPPGCTNGSFDVPFAGHTEVILTGCDGIDLTQPILLGQLVIASNPGATLDAPTDLTFSNMSAITTGGTIARSPKTWLSTVTVVAE
jgi:hypothetical protein